MRIKPTYMKQKKIIDVKKLRCFIMGYKLVLLCCPCTIDELAAFYTSLIYDETVSFLSATADIISLSIIRMV